MESRIGKRRLDITKNLLEDLYVKKKLSMPKIAKILNTSYFTVWNKMRTYEIKARSMSEAKIKYPKITFSGNLVEKAYMLGIRAGDISTAQASKQITVITATTHKAQLKMFAEIFGKYSKIKTYVTTIKFDGRKAWRIYCRLNNSFYFLLNKPNKIPKWILNSINYFYAFLAGYADCEACWNIYKLKDCKKFRLKFQIISGDKIILTQIKNKLFKLKFTPILRLAHKKGYMRTFGKYKKDMYRLNLNYQEDLIKLAKILLNLSHHEEKIWKMKFFLENKGKNWEDIKDKIDKFKGWLEYTNLNTSMQQSHFLLHANSILDEY